MDRVGGQRGASLPYALGVLAARDGLGGSGWGEGGN